MRYPSMRGLAPAGVVLLAGWLLAACGGGGGGGNNPPPPVTLLAAARYFPAPLGAHYRYQASGVTAPLFNPAPAETVFEYVVEANPLGAGVYYNLLDQVFARRGATFAGLSFTGLAEDDTLNFTGTRPTFVSGPGGTADVLPATLTGLGQQWPLDLRLGAPVAAGDPFIARFTLSGTQQLGAVEDVTLGGTTFADCLRVDVSFTYRYLGDALPLLSGNYWLAPDVGPVLGVARVAGVEVGRVQLVGASLP